MGGGEAPAAAGGPESEAAAAPVPINVMGLTAVRLRDELKKRGRAKGGNKHALQERLKEAIAMNMPVMDDQSSGANESRPPFELRGGPQPWAPSALTSLTNNQRHGRRMSAVNEREERVAMTRAK